MAEVAAVPALGRKKRLGGSSEDLRGATLDVLRAELGAPVGVLAGPHRGLLLGGPLEVLAALGPAEEVTCSANLSTLYCEGWEVDMAGGRVVDVRPR